MLDKLEFISKLVNLDYRVCYIARKIIIHLYKAEEFNSKRDNLFFLGIFMLINQTIQTRIKNELYDILFDKKSFMEFEIETVKENICNYFGIDLRKDILILYYQDFINTNYHLLKITTPINFEIIGNENKQTCNCFECIKNSLDLEFNSYYNY
jgi:hypothetical protein